MGRNEENNNLSKSEKKPAGQTREEEPATAKECKLPRIDLKSCDPGSSILSG
jgi:hypothetical protein